SWRPPSWSAPPRAPRSSGSRRPPTRAWTSSTSPPQLLPPTPRAPCWRWTTPSAPRARAPVLAVANPFCPPLGQQPLAHGADFAMLSGTKSLCGHSDVLLGAVAVRDPERGAALRRWRTLSGAIAGGFEAWLAHRSLATLGLRLERSSANATALAELL